MLPTAGGETLSASPLPTSFDAQISHSPSYFVSVAGVRKAGSTTPGGLGLEPLSFAKIPISPPASTCARSTSASMSVSTDCESAMSDAAPSADALSRSPSLLTSLIQSQARRSARTTPATTPGVSPTTTPIALPGATTQCGRPILRRCSSGAATSDDGAWKPTFALGTLPEKEKEQNEQSLQRRRSCLKFAVTPRPLQLHTGIPHAPGSRSTSAGSSRRASPRCATPALEEDDEEDEDVATPGFDSDDAGYQEDSEDGFTSDDDEDAPTLIPRPRTGQWPPTWGAMGVNPALALRPAPILSTAAKRAGADAADHPLPEPSTDDCGELGAPPRRARIRIRDDEKSAGKCSRHRSPPPVSRHVVLSAELERAPPAARSPSAADLCRRRSGVAPTPPSRSPAPASNMAKLSLARGWRSDDNARRTPAGGVTFLPQRSASERAEKACHVKFEVGPSQPTLRRKCSMLVRRDSAPAAGHVDEVHVLAANGSETPCPLAQLRANLGR